MGRIVELSPEPFYAKLHMATALPDNSIQLVSDSQVRSDAAQSCRCEYTVNKGTSQSLCKPSN